MTGKAIYTHFRFVQSDFHDILFVKAREKRGLKGLHQKNRQGHLWLTWRVRESLKTGILREIHHSFSDEMNKFT